ncbi:hypothetical protein sos41_33520 [Alphaproteobacteria bacterium SO-S41]|nr:hypothetical protein sos41_33520 [Alphaproteobacteria bacterium SO-S41]
MAKSSKPGKGEDVPAPRFHRRGPSKLAVQVGSTARQLAAGRGFSLLSVASRWRDIAGAALANHTQPLSISPSGVLTLKADGGAALLAQHQSREILARVNAVLGDGAVTSVKLVQGVVARGRAETPKPAPPRIAPDEEARVQAAVEAVSDPDLREKLTGLMRRSLEASKKR